MDTPSSQNDDAARLRALFKARATLSQLDFGGRYGLGTQGMVSQYLLGRRPLNVEAARKFAEGLGCTINEISPSLAQKIIRASRYVVTENGSGQPDAWQHASADAPDSWQHASAEAQEVARFVLSERNASRPDWATTEHRHAVDSMLYAALRWLSREPGRDKKIRAA